MPETVDQIRVLKLVAGDTAADRWRQARLPLPGGALAAEGWPEAGRDQDRMAVG